MFSLLKAGVARNEILIDAAYRDLIRTVDSAFGLYSLLVLALAIVAWIQGEASFTVAAWMVAFAAVNLLVSRLAVAFNYRSRMEFARIFVANGLLFPGVYASVADVVGSWWQGYLIFALGTGILVGGRTQRASRVAVAILFWMAHYIVIANFVARPAVPAIEQLLSLGAVAMVGAVMAKVTQTYARSVKQEQESRRDLAQALESLKTAQEKLVISEKFAALGEMAGAVAHEVKNPLAAIQLNTDLISLIAGRQPADLDLIEERSRKIVLEVRRIEEIASCLRIFTPGDSLNMETTPVSIRRVVTSVMEKKGSRARSEGVELECRLPETEVLAEGSSTHIAQALGHLLDNSLDAITETGSPGRISVTVVSNAEGVEISCEDSGVGVDPSISANVFDPFFSTKRPGGGRGLGLSVAREIIRRHGGRLELDDHSDSTRFVMSLPGRRTTDSIQGTV